jgi:hypothetical protein
MMLRVHGAMQLKSYQPDTSGGAQLVGFRLLESVGGW